jgi:hypothetical protein
MAWKVGPDEDVEQVLLADRDWHTVLRRKEGTSFHIGKDYFEFSEIVNHIEYLVRGPLESAIAVRVRKS